MAAGFRDLARAAQYLDDTIKAALIGLVPCNDVGDYENGTERWEKIINDKLDEIKFFNSKAILVNASQQKGMMPNCNIDTNMALDGLVKTLDSRLRWGKALQMAAISNSIHYGERNSQDSMIVKDLTASLSEEQRYLDRLEQEERGCAEQLAGVAEEWQKASLEFSRERNAEVAKEKQPEPVDEQLQFMLRKMEVMRLVTGKLLVAGQGYDWARDESSLRGLLPSLRREAYTAGSFQRSG